MNLQNSTISLGELIESVVMKAAPAEGWHEVEWHFYAYLVAKQIENDGAKDLANAFLEDRHKLMQTPPGHPDDAIIHFDCGRPAFRALLDGNWEDYVLVGQGADTLPIGETWRDLILRREPEYHIEGYVVQKSEESIRAKFVKEAQKVLDNFKQEKGIDTGDKPGEGEDVASLPDYGGVGLEDNAPEPYEMMSDYGSPPRLYGGILCDGWTVPEGHLRGVAKPTLEALAFLKRFVRRGLWEWYHQQTCWYGTRLDPLGEKAEKVGLPDGRFVRPYFYHRDAGEWVLVSPAEYYKQGRSTRHSQYRVLFRIEPGGDFLVGVIREWVTASMPRTPNPERELAEKLEADPRFQALVNEWPTRQKELQKSRSGERIDESRTLLGIGEALIFKDADTNRWTGELHRLADSPFSEADIHVALARLGLPFDPWTLAYTRWRILGGTKQEAPDEILPRRGGWVYTFVVAPHHEIESIGASRVRGQLVTQDEKQGWKIEALLEGKLTVAKPTVLASLSFSSAWMASEELGTLVGQVQQKHRRWCGRLRGLSLPANEYAEMGSKGGRPETEKALPKKRGPREHHPERREWWEMELKKTNFVRCDDIQKRARYEIELERQKINGLTTGLAGKTREIRRWIQLSLSGVRAEKCS